MHTRVVFAAMLLAGVGACNTPLCASGNYRQGECRVLIENELGRLALTDGTELRFQEPSAQDPGTWDALGLLSMRDGSPRARPAGLGDFAISITPGARTLPLHLALENVATDATLTLGPQGAEVAVAAPADGLRRQVQIPVSNATLWLRGRRVCPASFRLAALGDPQSNPLQFARILEQLIAENAASAAAHEPLLGLLVLGDLTESSTAFEFERVRELMQNSPVPIAVTAGNHDIYDDRTALYNTTFGPGNYAMDLCSARVVMLDTGNGALPMSVEARLPQLLDLHGRDHLVVGTHYPPYAALLTYGWGDENQAWRLLAAEARQASSVLNLNGHFHAWREFPKLLVGGRMLGEVMTGTGGGDQGLGIPQYGFTRVSVTDTLSWCFVQTPVPGGVALAPGEGLPGTRHCTRP